MTLAEQISQAGGAQQVDASYSIWGALVEIAKELSSSRELTRQLILRDLRIRYKQAVFGLLWAVLMPGLIVLSGLVIRFAVVQMTGTTFERKMAAALAVKSLAWGFFIGAIGLATPSLTSNSNLVTKVHFPREVLPLSAILAQGVDSGIGALIFLFITPFLGIGLSAALVWLPIVLALLFCLTVAAGLLFSCANAFFRDVKYLVQMFITFGIFYTPIFYEPATLGPVGAKLIMLNPVTPLLEGLRLAVVEGHNLLVPLSVQAAKGMVVVWSPWYLAYSAAVAILGLLASALIFHRAEAVYAEYV
ncbi:MAG TPA: ABC transporter permease [Gemmatimonadaceae bacterium]|nr:ABC transporter permease [Gemmatimonadaceae bacterium]